MNRNAILGTVAGLVIGTICSLAYSHFAGDGSLLSDLQSQLDSTKGKLDKAQSDLKFYKEQAKDESMQVDALNASKDALTKQITDKGETPVASADATTPAVDPNFLRGMLGMMRGGPGGGGFRSPEQRMFLMNARLKLTSDQQTKIKAAMDADEQARRDLFRQARQNHQPPDPQAMAAANTLDNTLKTVLTQGQQSEYAQMQNDEKAARAEISATQQVDNLMPLLQLTDDQKEKAMTAIYQQQASAPDAAALMNNPNPMGALAQQGQSIQKALQSVLSPDQYALYQQDQKLQAQMAANFMNGQGGQGGRRGQNGQNGQNGGGNNGGNGGQGGAPAGTQTAAVAQPSAQTSSTGTDTTASTTNAASASTNAASATTNAASATPPSN